MLFEVHAGTIINLYAHLKILFATSFLKKASERNAGSTPLHLACLAGSSDVAEYLINHAADLHRSSDKKEATKKKLMICGILWSLVVTSWHVDMTPREEWSWLVPAGPGVGNPHAPDAGAEGLKCWGWWDWEDLKSFCLFYKKQAALWKTSVFFSAVKFHQV